jgi:hypothetical protein
MWLPYFTLAQNPKIGECYTYEEKGIKYCFAADSTTFDKALGDSFRILIVSNSQDDSELARYYLNVNLSADFAYIFNDDYIEKYGIMIIQGVSSFYIYDVINNILSNHVRPEKRDCEVSDAQGGYVRNLLVLEQGRILQLEIVECGIRNFNIENNTHIKEI